MFSSDFAADLRTMNRQRLQRRVTQAILRVQALAHETQRLRESLGVIAQEMQRLHLLNIELMMADAKRKGNLRFSLARSACLPID